MASPSEEMLASFGVSQQVLAQFCASLCSDAKAILFRKLLYTEVSFNLSTLGDDFSDDKDIAANYRDQSGSATATPSKIAYRKSIEAFLELMLVLFLFIGGQPDQGPEIFAREKKEFVPGELISITHSAKDDSVRNVCVSHGAICIMTADHHSEHGVRMRFMSPEVSETMVLYLACALPFYRTLDPNECYSVSNFVFATQPGTWHTARYESILKRETKGRLGVEMDLTRVNDLIRQMTPLLK